MPKRPLSMFERQEAGLVFLTSVNLDDVEIVEDDWLALKIETVGSRLTRRDARETNAVTLGNLIRFSRALRFGEDHSEQQHIDDMAWLIHELTHVWQYQHVGWKYLAQALGAQITEGAEAYRYSDRTSLSGRGEDLQQMWQQGRRFADFNREQQGDIARDYYIALKKALDTTGWLPFIQELQAPS